MTDWNRQTTGPELLEAAKLGLEFADGLEDEGCWDTNDEERRGKIKAAIAKAEPKP